MILTTDRQRLTDHTTTTYRRGPDSKNIRLQQVIVFATKRHRYLPNGVALPFVNADLLPDSHHLHHSLELDKTVKIVMWAQDHFTQYNSGDATSVDIIHEVECICIYIMAESIFDETKMNAFVEVLAGLWLQKRKSEQE